MLHGWAREHWALLCALASTSPTRKRVVVACVFTSMPQKARTTFEGQYPLTLRTNLLLLETLGENHVGWDSPLRAGGAHVVSSLTGFSGSDCLQLRYFAIAENLP